MSALIQPLVSVINMIVSIIHGLIVGAVTFCYNLLDGLDNIDSLFTHAMDSVTSFFQVFLNLGQALFPFLPAEWIGIIEIMLIVLIAGLIIKKKVM